MAPYGVDRVLWPEVLVWPEKLFHSGGNDFADGVLTGPKQQEDAMSEVLIDVQNLAKSYGGFRAVKGVSFDVRRGEVLGFLGPNGAGKSTTMKMLTCVLAPTEGTAKVAGFDVFDQSLAVRERIGYLPEDTPLYKDLSVVEYLDFVGRTRGMSPPFGASVLKKSASAVALLRQRVNSLVSFQKASVNGSVSPRPCCTTLTS